MSTDTRPTIAGPIRLAAGTIDGHDRHNPTCGNCGETDDLGALFGITAQGIPGRICSDCADTHPAGTVLVTIAEALEEIDTAAYYAPPPVRAGLIALTLDTFQWLGERYAEGRGAAPTEQEVWSLASSTTRPAASEDAA